MFISSEGLQPRLLLLFSSAGIAIPEYSSMEYVVSHDRVNMMKGSYMHVLGTNLYLYNFEVHFISVKVGVHQGSVLSPLLFIMVLEALSIEFRTGCPWELLSK